APGECRQGPRRVGLRLQADGRRLPGPLPRAAGAPGGEILMRVLTITNLYPNPYQPLRAPFNRDQLRLLGERHPVPVIAPIAWTDELAARRQGRVRLPGHRRFALDRLTVDCPRYLFTPRVLRNCYGRFYRASVKPTFTRILDEFQPEIVYAP